ncbi:MAG: hypothetical protein ABR498_06560, partial [Candidatus Dormibacteria bacterium]
MSRTKQPSRDPIRRRMRDRDAQRSRMLKGSAAGEQHAPDVHTPVDAMRALGPGLITGASDADPSGIGTYSQAGAQSGYG